MIIRMIINAIYLFLIILALMSVVLGNLLYINLILSKKIKIQLINALH